MLFAVQKIMGFCFHETFTQQRARHKMDRLVTITNKLHQ